MGTSETLDDFYQRKFDWMPDSVRQNIGHFNVFRLDPFVGPQARPVPYKRRDFFKITLAVGAARVHFADRVVEVQRQALVFSNPGIPYKWENTEHLRTGFFCIFNPHFFDRFGNLLQYELFQPGGNPIFELSDPQRQYIENVFERMLSEMDSDYQHKYDVLRLLTAELLHFAMKLQPSRKAYRQQTNASQRIATLFAELLERQFPIDENHPCVGLRTASGFAGQLNIHVNHLNRALRETTCKTTSQLIAERLLQEAKILLRHSTLNVSEIAYALGFSEVTHFNNFFKKHTHCSPTQFRNI